MTQAYSNPDREQDPHALPDIEVFQLTMHYVAAVNAKDALDAAKHLFS